MRIRALARLEMNSYFILNHYGLVIPSVLRAAITQFLCKNFFVLARGLQIIEKKKINRKKLHHEKIFAGIFSTISHDPRVLKVIRELIRNFFVFSLLPRRKVYSVRILIIKLSTVLVLKRKWTLCISEWKEKARKDATADSIRFS